jgi:tRNA (mo5U34)-methyltransferase
MAPVDRELQLEIEAGPAWMYPWQLSDRIITPLMGPELASIHRTRAELIEPHVRATFGKANHPARAIDIACHEGWFAHRLLEWGADEVLAIDIRDLNVRRAQLLRAHFEVPQSRLDIRRADVFELNANDLGAFDVVLMLGLIYHLENPVGAIRVARNLTRRLCVVESQLTRQHDPIETGWGIADEFMYEDASWAAHFEPLAEQETQPLAAFGGALSLIPNEAAVIQAMEVAGLDGSRRLLPNVDHNSQYVEGDRGVFIGYGL